MDKKLWEPSELKISGQMLRNQADDIFPPANDKGQKHFGRVVMEAAAAEIEVVAKALESEAVEEFIRNLPWSDQATEHDRTIAAGNIRNFANHIRSLSATPCEEAAEDWETTPN